METIPFDMLHNWWDGKVKVRKLKPFEDNRGLLGEIFRQDSDSFKNIVNTYVSETRPFIKRGPHEHNFQDDEFITWNSRMVYEFYNPETKEFKYFITEPKGIYSLYVEHNIHHGYRNLDSKEISYTLNSLNKLYKGFGRNDEPDEIRHERNTVDNKILFIFGAGGKLGKALTEAAYRKVGQHTFEVVSCFDKILDHTSFSNFVQSIETVFKGKDVTFINCASLTNTKESGPMNEAWNWSNVKLPLMFAGLCSENNWSFVQLSTNYVYQEVKPGFINYYLSTYTQSKKVMESVLLDEQYKKDTNTTVLLRVANLFNSKDTNDENIFSRFSNIIKEKGNISVDENEHVAPTDVNVLSDKIVELFLDGSFKTEKIKKINIVPEIFNLKEFVVKNFGITPLPSISKIKGNIEIFSKDNSAKIVKI
jgi:dTDP-4-dehydrorhamnose reductase/dTDP-4-dehydrorhamnose 3,5-epimerase-like enzyme